MLELRAALPIPADQRWFWTERWQGCASVRSTSTSRPGGWHAHESAEGFLDHLDDLHRGEVRDHASLRRRLPSTEARARRRFQARRAGEVRAGVRCVRDGSGVRLASSTSGEVGEVGPWHPGDDLVVRRPDGRATFEMITADGELRCRWRTRRSTTGSSSPVGSRARPAAGEAEDDGASGYRDR